jgi:hypothetical protein
VGARLARKKQRDQDGEEHHVAREAREEKEANLVKQLARTTALVLPVVIAPTPSTAGWPAIYGWLAADSWLFPFRFRRGVRKGSGHPKPLCKSDYTTLVWTQTRPKGMVFIHFGCLCRWKGLYL